MELDVLIGALNVSTIKTRASFRQPALAANQDGRRVSRRRSANPDIAVLRVSSGCRAWDEAHDGNLRVNVET
jgi:hypothetical protein